LDTGPLVALIDRSDDNHERAKRVFESLGPPFITCESVISESIFLLQTSRPTGPEKVLSLGQEGYYQIGIDLKDNFPSILEFIKKYKERPISLADACLIRCAEIHNEPRILTFDSDFEFYRWGRNKKFEVLK
jgi:predicted nucleic acid-binding protein